MAIHRFEIEALLATPGACEVDAARRAIAQLDYGLLERILLARGRSGASVPIELVAQLVPRLDAPGQAALLLALADGDRTSAILDLLDHDEFPHDPMGCDLRAVAIYAAWKLRGSDGVRDRLAAHARLLVRECQVAGLASPIMVVRHLAPDLGDEALTTRLQTVADMVPGPEAIALIAVREYLSTPREVLRTACDAFDLGDPFVRHISGRILEILNVRVGRNKPCPCRSGRKFKHCHGGGDDLVAQARAPAGTPVRAQVVSRPRSVEDIMRMPLSALGGLPLQSLNAQLVWALLERLLKYRLWHETQRVLDVVSGRSDLDLDVRHSVQAAVASTAIECKRYDIAVSSIQGLPEQIFHEAGPVIAAVAAVGARSPDALERLLAILERAVRDDSGGVAGSVATHFSPVSPALALLLIRACIAANPGREAKRLLRHAELARAELGLASGDPAARCFEAIERVRLDDAERARLTTGRDEEIGQLRATIEDFRRLLRERDQQISELQQQQRASISVATSPPPASPTVADPVELRALKVKIEDLQAMIRERNAELADLRKQTLERGEVTGPRPLPTLPPAELDDGDEGWEDAPSRDRRIEIPVWSDGARAALDSVPMPVAREALRTVGELAAGEPAAWRAVKRPKGLRDPLLMARIGIHHRLLFRSSERTLEVLDLLSREALLLALKRYA